MRGDVYKLIAYYDEHPKAGPKEAAKAVGCNRNTASSAKNRWKQARGYAVGSPQHPVRGLVKVGGFEEQTLTFEQIVKAVPDVETLGVILFHGMMRKMDEKDAAYEVLKEENLKQQALISNLKRELEEMTKDRNKLIGEYNELLARKKVGTLTLDQVEHKLIPKG